MLIGLILALLMFFLSMFRKDIYADNRKMFIILLIVTTMLVVLSWALRMKIPSLYFIPYCIVPIIIRVIFDTRLALYIHLLVVIIAGFFVPNGYEFIFLQITAGMVAINSIKNLLRRSQFLASAILIYLTYVVGFIGISIIHEGSFLNIQWENVLWFMISVVLSLLAYPLIYAFEKLFGITTEVTLMEYTNINTPLLRELSYKAPGTFQHSLQVANLAEAAVFEIGGNALLIRAGALYHDVGKIESPQYFIENQQKGINPHDQLSDEDSAKVIIRHVYAGIELANKHRLPQEIIDFIRTHHGSTRVDFFYHSFIKNYPELSINEKMFRYPGPIPFSKETAILMLADSVEAASRSLKEPSAQSIDDLVERIIDYKVSQQQLIDSDITIKEIYRIKAIFKEMLKSIYHVRIEY
jgi:putative nucleotidyltransferase with HDIG domain